MMHVLHVSEMIISSCARSQTLDVKVLQFPFFSDVKDDRLIQYREGAVVDVLPDFAEPFEVSAIVSLRYMRQNSSSFKDIPFENQLDNLRRQFI